MNLNKLEKLASLFAKYADDEGSPCPPLETMIRNASYSEGSQLKINGISFVEQLKKDGLTCRAIIKVETSAWGLGTTSFPTKTQFFGDNVTEKWGKYNLGENSLYKQIERFMLKNRSGTPTKGYKPPYILMFG